MKIYLGVQGPSQLLSAYSSYLSFSSLYFQKKVKRSLDISFLFYETGCSLHGEKKLYYITNKILKTLHPKYKLYHLTNHNFKRILKIQDLKKCSYLFLARNSYSFFNSYLNSHVNKKTVQICYGDGFGYFDSCHWQFLANKKILVLKKLIKHLLQRAQNGCLFKRPFSYYSGSIPVWSKKRKLDPKKLIIESKKSFIKLFKIIHNSIKEIYLFENRTLAKIRSKKAYLILPANLAGHLSEKKELSLICKKIYDNVPKKSLILLKIHVRKSGCFVKKLVSKLKGDYQVKTFSQLHYYPIELFYKIILSNKIEVISILTGSAWSLKYFFNKKCINPVNSKTIKLLFPPPQVYYIRLTNIILKSVYNQITRQNINQIIVPRITSDTLKF